jgi:hypothetical protein
MADEISNEDAITVASAIGFAIATISAFMKRPGVGSDQVRECLRLLEEAKQLLTEEME